MNLLSDLMSFDVCKSWTWPQKLEKLVERDLPKCESHAEELKKDVNKAKEQGIFHCKLLIARGQFSLTQYLLYFLSQALLLELFLAICYLD